MTSFVGFVPTHPDHIDAFFELVPLMPADVVYDLGSGDGRLVFAALANGARKAVGVELASGRVRRAKSEARMRGFGSSSRFLLADVTEVNLAEASVVFCYLSPQASAVLKPKFERELAPGTRVVMESFPVPGWTPTRTTTRGYTDYYEVNEFYLYVMPAKA